MSETIADGKGSGRLAEVTADQRLAGDVLTATYSNERSRTGNLFGTGTGSITPTGAMSLAPVLWLRNDSKANEGLFVQKLIFGWNGGSTNFNRTILSFIKYNTSEPTTNISAATDQIENISLSGSSSAVTSGKTTAWKWDGAGADVGMTGGSGGFLQIPNRLGQGNTSIPIDGEIILGPGNSMEMQVSPEETGLYNVAIVFYFAPLASGRTGAA